MRHTHWGLMAVLVAGTALAQFREPPKSEAESLAVQAEEMVTKAAEKLAKGDRAGAQEKYGEAFDTFNQALDSDPNLVRAATGLGMTGALLGKNDVVFKRLKPFVDAHPDADEPAFHLGVAAYKLRQYPLAMSLFEKVAPKDTPESAPFLLAHYFMGSYYVQTGRSNRAAEELTRYLQVRPKKLAQADGEIYVLLGQAYLNLRRPNEARTAFTYAQAGRPENTAVQLGLESVLELEGKPKEAIDFLNAFAARQPKLPEPKERLGRLLLREKDVPRAEAQANELLKLGETPSARHLMGDVKIAKGDAKGAEADLRKAATLAPASIPVQVSLARSLLMQKRNDEAVQLLEGAAAKDPSPEILAAYGTVARRAGKFQKAIEAHEKVVAASPDQPLGHMLLAADRYATGEWDPCIDEYTAALKLAPEEPRAKHFLALALNHRARARAENTRLEDAARDLRRAMDLEATPLTGLNLGAVLLAQKNPVEARPVLQRASELPGATWRHHLVLGYAALAASDAAGAVNAFEQAAKLTQEDPALSEIYAGWSLAKLELGEFDAALAKLNEPGKSKGALAVIQGNLPLALVKRALGSVRAGDVEKADKDLEAVDKLRTAKATDTTRLIDLAHAMADLEHGKTDKAIVGFKKSLAGASFAVPTSVGYLSAYAEYRRGEIPQARKLIITAQKTAGKPEKEWAVALMRAVDRRDGELSTLKGNLPQAERALKQAFEAEPLTPFVVANRATVAYRKGQKPVGLKGWEQVQDAIPEAALNLGIDAQDKGDAAKAVNQYGRYVAANGSRAAAVREWIDRLTAIYGVKAPEMTPAPAEGAPPTEAAAEPVKVGAR